VTLLDQTKDLALTPKTDLATQIVAMASDPGMDVGKLEKLMQMQREMATIRAKAEFNAAMSDAQKQMRPIAADAVNPQTRSKYATYAALDSKLRPIYTEAGFGLSFNTADGARDGWIRVVCNVSHIGGFDKDYHVDMPADGKGAKGGDVMTLTHAVGAGLSYGMRYLLKMIFNVAVGEDDRDGNDPTPVTDPKGFTDWAEDLQLVAKEQGFDALKAAWTKSKAEFREHMTKHYGPKWEVLKKESQKVKV
jgi:hypothetical protein